MLAKHKINSPSQILATTPVASHRPPTSGTSDDFSGGEKKKKKAVSPMPRCCRPTSPCCHHPSSLGVAAIHHNGLGERGLATPRPLGLAVIHPQRPGGGCDPPWREIRPPLDCWGWLVASPHAAWVATRSTLKGRISLPQGVGMLFFFFFF
jgi:hypothetical protein